MSKTDMKLYSVASHHTVYEEVLQKKTPSGGESSRDGVKGVQDFRLGRDLIIPLQNVLIKY